LKLDGGGAKPGLYNNVMLLYMLQWDFLQVDGSYSENSRIH
jgi:hypothetical protein